MLLTPSTRLAPEESSDSGALSAWLEWLGLRFDPFGPLDAAADPRLGEYLVGHEVFARAWGDWPSWIFAPPGGGKTALRVRTAQACWVGQETNRPFPISYTPPFLSWGHASPSLDDHLAALARTGAMVLLLALAYRPHWLLRLGAETRRTVKNVLDWNLPGPLDSYLARCRRPDGLRLLHEALGSTFALPDPPDGDTLLRWCDTLDTTPGDGSSPAPSVRWEALCKVLLEVLQFRSIYVLADGLDAAPEAMAEPQVVADCLVPLMSLVGDWADRRVFFKGFLPVETKSLLVNRFPAITHTHMAVIDWQPPLLAEIIRRRVYVACEGAFGSLDAISSPALRDVETILAKAALPLPREILVLTRRVLEEHVRREGNDGIIREEDIDAAIQWYNAHKPQIALGEATHVV